MTEVKHPLYGTCTGCTQVKGVKKDGRMRPHTRLAGGGNMQMTVDCAGSNLPYAESGRQRWDARQSRWCDMPIEIMTTTRDLDGEEYPMIVEAHPFPEAKAGYEIFVAKKCSVHLRLVEKKTWANIYGVQLRDADGAVLKSEDEVHDDGQLNGLMLRWLEQLADEAKSAG